MNIKNNFVLILILIFSFNINAQESDNKDIFWDAETYFYNSDYKDALKLYQSLLKNDNDNSNLNYKVGVCYLKGYNNPSEKTKAISYLEKAITSVSKDYKEGELTETNAPEDAYIYLGDSYLLANKADKAKKAYENYKEVSKTNDDYFLQIVNRKIETCISAKELRAISVKYELVNYGKVINNQFANYNGVLSRDGMIYAFTTNMKFYEAVMYSRKVDGKFETPHNFNVEAKVEGSIRSLSLSSDGTELYLFKNVKNNKEKGNIYVSHWVDGKWTEIEKLGSNINTSNLEMHASLSPDDSTLYFSSNRKGGYGSLDIYKSKRQSNGNWGKAVNLGDKINTKFDERSPFILRDGKTMYFSSQGHTYNIGGNDFFMSIMDENENWSKPLNFGFPISTTDDNLFMCPISKNKAIIAMATNDGFGDLDLYELKFFPQNDPSVIVKGKLDNQGKEIAVIIDVDGNQVKTKTNKQGEFEQVVPAGEISIKLNADNMETVNKNVTAPSVYCLAEIDISDTELKHSNSPDNSSNNTADNAIENNNTNKDNISGLTIKTIFFGFNKDIPEKNQSELNLLADYLNSTENILIEIKGYADLQGDESYNMYLSKKRADFVKNYLINKGVSESKLTSKGYGEANQISIDLNPLSRKYNRRVVFSITRDGNGKLKIEDTVIPENYRIK